MAQAHHAGPKTGIRRKRTGCLTCRERRVRCGEERPTCRNCSRKSRACTWGHDVRFLHHEPSIGKRPYKLDDKPDDLDEDHRNQPSKCPTQISPSRRLSTFSASADDTSSLTSHSTSLLHPLESPLSSSITSHSASSSIPSGRPPWQRSGSSTTTMSPDEASCWQSEVLRSFATGPSNNPGDQNLASSICRSNSARLKDSIDIEHASPIPPNLEPNAEGFSSWRTLGASDIVLAALDGDMEMKLLQTYLNECAKWFDCRERHYSRKDVPRMMSCPPWRAAALALSAKHLELRERKETTAESLSLHLYQLAVTLAIDSISGRFDCVGTTAGCVLLAVYEMLSVRYQDWRRHLRGCTSIYSHNHWNGDSLGLIGASFWNYARIDIWAAFCAETETMLPSSSWFNHPNTIMHSTNLNEDRHAQIATWLLSRVVNLKHGGAEPTTPSSHTPTPTTTTTSSSSSSSSNTTFHLLQADMTTWETMGSPITHPVMRRTANPTADRPFPSILFSNDSSTISYTMWHTAKVLLLEYELEASRSRSQTQSQTQTQTQAQTGRPAQHDAQLSQSIYEHARTACGIIETNNHNTCLVNAVQPLWICGRNLKTRSEKFAVLELLAQVEQRTGWKTRWRSDALREMWNLC